MGKKNVLVTGGAGAIGSNLTRALLAEGHKVFVIDNLSSGNEDNLPISPELKFYQGDIVDDELLKLVFKQDIDTVFHLAAFFANQNSIEFPESDLNTNGLGTLKLLIYARENNIRRFLFSSSSCVYKPSNEHLKEDNPQAYESPYSITKHLGEEYVKFYADYHKLDYCIFRFFNSFGPGEYPGTYRNVIPNFLYQALNSKALIITGSGEEVRCFCYVADLVKGIISAWKSENTKNKTINLGNNNCLSINYLASIVNEMCDNVGNIRYIPRRKWDNTEIRMPDLSAAQELMNYQATYSFKNGLIETKKWFQENSIHKKKFY